MNAFFFQFHFIDSIAESQFPGKTDYYLLEVLIPGDLNGSRSEKTNAEYKANSDSLPWIMILCFVSPSLSYSETRKWSPKIATE